MYLAASLFAAFVITLLSVSRIAKMLNAKRPDIGFIILATLTGSILAAVTIVSLGLFVPDLEPKVMLVFTLMIIFILSSAAYKYINQLKWSGAFTLNIASMAIGTMTLVAAIVLNGNSLNKSLDLVAATLNESASFKSTLSTSDAEISNDTDTNNPDGSTLTGSSQINKNALNADNEILADDEEAVISELDLLPASTVRAIKKKEKRVFVEPKFRVISIASIHTAVGYRIRISRKNGNTITGGLRRMNGNDAVISQYTSRGTVVMPISLSKINKLEVYR